MINMLIVILLGIVLYIPSAYSKPAPSAAQHRTPRIRISSGSRASSEDLSESSIRLRALSAPDIDSVTAGERSDSIYYGILGVYAWGTVGTQEFNARHADLVVGWHLLDGVTLEAVGGLHHLDVSSAFIVQDLFYRRAALGVRPFENVKLKASVQNDFFYIEHFQPGLVLNPLTDTAVTLNGEALFWHVLRMVLSGSNHAIADGNSMNNGHGRVVYALLSKPFEIWAGVQGKSLSFGEHRTLYWSPTAFSSFGPTVEAVVPLSDSFFAGGEVDYSHAQEDNYPSAQLTSFLAYLQWNRASALGLRVGYVSDQELHSGNTSTESGIQISAVGDF